MKAAFHGKMYELYETLSDLISRLPKGGDIDYVRIFISYAVITQKRETVVEFAKTMNKYSETIGGDMVSAAEEWLMEGEMKKEIEIIENLVKAGADWNLIFKATGIDQLGFKKLKKKWGNICSASVQFDLT